MTTSHIRRLRLWPRRISSGVMAAALLGGVAIGPGDVLREGGVSSSVLGVARAQVGGGEETPATKAAREALQAAIDKARAEGKLLIVTFSNSRENVAANARMLQNGALRRWLAPRANTHDITDRGVIASVMTTLTGTEITPVAAAPRPGADGRRDGPAGDGCAGGRAGGRSGDDQCQGDHDRQGGVSPV
ncbi:MAG: hypothetical protein MUE97_07595 [Phycisphaerales bacterium]|nr:hypothetical protein [Phycisphaerales bacterium]